MIRVKKKFFFSSFLTEIDRFSYTNMILSQVKIVSLVMEHYLIRLYLPPGKTQISSVSLSLSDTTGGKKNK